MIAMNIVEKGIAWLGIAGHRCVSGLAKSPVEKFASDFQLKPTAEVGMSLLRSKK
jgi:hypothetical protein